MTTSVHRHPHRRNRKCSANGKPPPKETTYAALKNGTTARRIMITPVRCHRHPRNRRCRANRGTLLKEGTYARLQNGTTAKSTLTTCLKAKAATVTNRELASSRTVLIRCGQSEDQVCGLTATPFTDDLWFLTCDMPQHGGVPAIDTKCEHQLGALPCPFLVRGSPASSYVAFILARVAFLFFLNRV